MKPSTPRPLIVRLRNWVGDVTLSLPLLQRLAQAGFDLTLVGKGWARDLLAGQGWPVHVLPKAAMDRVRLLRQLRTEAGRLDTGFGRRINALCLPDSFSSALEFRLAGLRALGHAWEGRGLLLGHAVPRPRGLHELQVYWQLGDALLGQVAPLPERIALLPTAEQMAQAAALHSAHGIEAGCVLICPFVSGTWNHTGRNWQAFAEFVSAALPTMGRSVVICPGPGEEERVARAHFASAHLLRGVDLGVYAALLKGAALMVSNDTGPGHLAAAVGTPLISVIGPSSDPSRWHPWGPNVQVLGGHDGWPDLHSVLQAAERLLGTR